MGNNNFADNFGRNNSEAGTDEDSTSLDEQDELAEDDEDELDEEDESGNRSLEGIF
jgi:hypothetical protein